MNEENKIDCVEQPRGITRLDFNSSNEPYFAAHYGDDQGTVKIINHISLSSIYEIAPPTGFNRVQAIIPFSGLIGQFMVYYSNGVGEYKHRALQLSDGSELNIVSGTNSVLSVVDIPEKFSILKAELTTAGIIIVLMNYNLVDQDQFFISGTGTPTTAQMAIMPNTQRMAILTDHTSSNFQVFHLDGNFCDQVCATCKSWKGTSTIGAAKQGCLTCQSSTVTLENYGQDTTDSSYQGGDCLITCSSTNYINPDNTLECLPCPDCCSSCSLDINTTQDGFNNELTCVVIEGYNFDAVTKECSLKESGLLNVINISIGERDDILIITFDGEVNPSQDFNNRLEIRYKGSVISFTASSIGTELILKLDSSMEKNQDSYKLEFKGIATTITEAKQKLIENQIFKFYPVENQSISENILSSLISNKPASDALELSFNIGPFLVFTHRAIVMIVQSIALLKLYPYMPIQYSKNVQWFLYAFSRDREVSLMGEEFHSIKNKLQGISKEKEQSEFSLKKIHPTNKMFSQPLIYIRLLGLKILGRYLINIILLTIVFRYKNKSTILSEQKKSVAVGFIVKLLVNLGLILNFETFQCDGKLALFSLTQSSSVVEITLIFLDIFIFSLAHLYLWTLFENKQSLKKKGSNQLKPYQEYMYKNVFVFQKKNKFKITFLDNWSEEIFPVRIVDNMMFLLKILIIKAFNLYPFAFFVSFNLLNVTIFYVVIFKFRVRFYHRLLVYYKMKWGLEFITNILATLNLFIKGEIFSNFILYSMATYLIFNLVTPMILIIRDIVSYFINKRKNKSTRDTPVNEMLQGEPNRPSLNFAKRQKSNKPKFKIKIKNRIFQKYHHQKTKNPVSPPSDNDTHSHFKVDSGRTSSNRSESRALNISSSLYKKYKKKNERQFKLLRKNRSKIQIKNRVNQQLENFLQKQSKQKGDNLTKEELTQQYKLKSLSSRFRFVKVKKNLSFSREQNFFNKMLP